MTDRRPVRNRKSVNYSGFDDCSDDDFADSTPPPLKKQKSTKAPEKSKSIDSDDSETPPPLKKQKSTNAQEKYKSKDSDGSDEKLPEKSKEHGRKGRAALSDKIYERELQKALQLSLSSSQEVAVVHSSSDSLTKMSEIKHEINDTQLPADSADLGKGEKSSPKVNSSNAKSTENKCLEVPQAKLIGTVMDESIEILEDSKSIETAQRKITPTRSARTRKKKPLSSDDESEESSEESEDSYSDEDYDDNSDVDFDEKKKSTSTKSKTQPSRTKSTKAEKTVKNTSPKAKKLSKAANSATSNNASNKSTSSGSDVSSLSKTSSRPGASSPPGSDKSYNSHKSSSSIQSVKVTKAAPSLASSWKPPAMSSPGSSNSLPTVKSPTTGLRLGLSRNQYIKPLHKLSKVT